MSQTTVPVLDRPLPVAPRSHETTSEELDSTTTVAPPAAAGSLRRVTVGGNWTQWILLIAFIFIAMESTLMALVMQGRWLILLAPGVVCASKAWEQWRVMKGKEHA